MKLRLFGCCWFALAALLATATAAVSVTVESLPDHTLRFVVLETMRDLVRHRPATRRYEFTTPMSHIVRADQIRSYHARYQGADGMWLTHREPSCGYILLSHPLHPRRVEFRLLENWEVSVVVPMTINGKHRVKVRHP